MSNISIIS